MKSDANWSICLILEELDNSDLDLLIIGFASNASFFKHDCYSWHQLQLMLSETSAKEYEFLREDRVSSW